MLIDGVMEGPCAFGSKSDARLGCRWKVEGSSVVGGVRDGDDVH